MEIGPMTGQGDCRPSITWSVSKIDCKVNQKILPIEYNLRNGLRRLLEDNGSNKRDIQTQLINHYVKRLKIVDEKKSITATISHQLIFRLLTTTTHEIKVKNYPCRQID